MAINKTKALRMFNTYHAALPARNLQEVDMLVECNAQLGHENLEIFVAESVCERIVASLRKRGFVVKYVKFQSNNNWRLVAISWTAEEFTQ